MILRKGDKVLIDGGVFDGFIGIVLKEGLNNNFIVILKMDYKLRAERVQIVVQVHKNNLRKVTVLDAKDLEVVRDLRIENKK